MKKITTTLTAMTLVLTLITTSVTPATAAVYYYNQPAPYQQTVYYNQVPQPIQYQPAVYQPTPTYVQTTSYVPVQYRPARRAVIQQDYYIEQRSSGLATFLGVAALGVGIAALCMR